MHDSAAGSAPETPVLDADEVIVTRPATEFRLRLPRLILPGGGARALMGPSGAGKTTLLLGLFGLQGVASRGTVRVLGRPVPATASAAWRELMTRQVCVVLQDARAALDPVRSIGGQLAAATGAPREAIVEALAELDIQDPVGLAARWPHEVSGGQAQRALLAVALLRRPRLLVLDEPSAGLDPERIEDLLRCLALLRERTGTAILVATHDRYLVDGLDAEPLAIRGGVFASGDSPQPEWPRWRDDEPAQPGEVLVAARGVSVQRGGSWILRDVDLEVRRGEVVALVGPSGGGKTTLARVLCGQLGVDRGRVERPADPRLAQMLFQDAYASLTPHLTLRAALAEVSAPDFDTAGHAHALGLAADRLERRPSELSGGERRRAALLRALSVDPDCLILDEPTASLDRSTAVTVMHSLMQIHDRRSLGILIATHDLELAEAIADRTVRIDEGRT